MMIARNCIFYILTILLFYSKPLQAAASASSSEESETSKARPVRYGDYVFFGTTDDVETKMSATGDFKMPSDEDLTKVSPGAEFEKTKRACIHVFTMGKNAYIYRNFRGRGLNNFRRFFNESAMHQAGIGRFFPKGFIGLRASDSPSLSEETPLISEMVTSGLDTGEFDGTFNLVIGRYGALCYKIVVFLQ